MKTCPGMLACPAPGTARTVGIAAEFFAPIRVNGGTTETCYGELPGFFHLFRLAGPRSGRNRHGRTQRRPRFTSRLDIAVCSRFRGRSDDVCGDRGAHPRTTISREH